MYLFNNRNHQVLIKCKHVARNIRSGKAEKITPKKEDTFRSTSEYPAARARFETRTSEMQGPNFTFIFTRL